VVWVFVNPTQFNNPADLQRYPRTLDADVAICQAAGAAAVYAPAADEVYPPGQPIRVPTLPDAATRPGLEDAHRPGHFAGVCQVVARMFDLVRPAAAIFGEKDWQQLAVVRAMVEQEHTRTQILPEPTVREPDGLAMSSRNVFLTPDDRRRARALSHALAEAGKHPDPEAAQAAMMRTLGAAEIVPDYAVVRDAASLMPLTDPSRPGRALIAAQVGSVRLIDNASWGR
jgi:pantoate--beta-alanine ligase